MHGRIRSFLFIPLNIAHCWWIIFYFAIHIQTKSCTVHISKTQDSPSSTQLRPMVRTKEHFGVIPCLCGNSFEYLLRATEPPYELALCILQFAFGTKSYTFHISYVLYLQSPMALFPVHNSGQWVEKGVKTSEKHPKLSPDNSWSASLCPHCAPSAFEANRGILTVPLWMIWRPHVNSTFWILHWKWVVLCPKRHMPTTPMYQCRGCPNIRA